MKHTQEELKQAVLTMAKELGSEKSFQALIDSNFGMTTIVNNIVSKLFISTFNSIGCSDQLYEAYKIIREYASELDSKGFVEFGK